MQFVDLKPLGKNPEADAVSMRQLCIDSSADASIMEEFAPTVDFFVESDQAASEERLRQRFSEDKVGIGNFILFNGVECGFVAANQSNMPIGDKAVKGVNVSLWIVNGFRGIGIGKYATRSILDAALKEIETNEAWRDRVIWTAIAKDNITSRRLFTNSGFAMLHPLTEHKKGEYSAYVFGESTDETLTRDYGSLQTLHESSGR